MAATEEAYYLANSHYYNPNWGYQNGEKRNALCLTLLWLCAIPLAIHSPLFVALLAGQLLGYALVMLIQLTPVHPWPGLFRKIHYLVLGHWYNGIGTLRYGLRMLARPTSQERAA